MTSEFEEIGHSGGKITFSVRTNDKGVRAYQVGFSSSRPVPMVMTAVYALPQGVPVASIKLGGEGQLWGSAPFPGCFPVFIASDSQGKFGHNCPQCDRYWRSSPWPNVCPYCATILPSYEFLSEAQLRYVHHYCGVLSKALDSRDDGEVVIDMDAVADAVGKEGEKPAFYISEESQQCKFTCGACGEFNDILGRFGYCSLCGTRNDLADFEGETVPTIRVRLNSGNAPEDCVRDAVASFDSYMSQVAKQLVELVPMTKPRKNRLSKQRFYDLKEICTTLKEWFDINLCAGMKEDEYGFVVRMFHRRHVYEHNGGEVDQKYLDDSGDTTVRLKQHIHETQQDAHNLLGSLLKMARNVHSGFHAIFPPIPEPIKAFEDKKVRMEKYAKGEG
ncbi:MAG: hypothetical protein WC645_08420 [Candidatus Margulisiibacteriota bacterium]